MTVPTMIAMVVTTNTGRDALLWINGTLGVRIMCMTKVCDHRDSTNQPAWNSAINKTEFTPGAPKEPPQTAGQMTKYKITYVIISKMELTGPIHTINFPIEEASHLRGCLKNSVSMLSHGIEMQEIS